MSCDDLRAQIAVRCLRLAPAHQPITPVTVDVSQDQGGEPGVWAALTADEARDLARLLLLHADPAERGTDTLGPPPKSNPSF
ncbi:hypothetical protein [Streptomyces umbrinus]|uniref:hypothetical protein n=1 Tax=Streptomyces umbrinus TaxID=67370 RepID=UPI0033FBD80D